jgi:hypothetical protein
VLLIKYCSSDQIKNKEMGGQCSTCERIGEVRTRLVGKPEEKRIFERPRCRWDDNIKVDLQKIR